MLIKCTFNICADFASFYYFLSNNKPCSLILF
nr:MAG TPA: hypothetical protein [Caudoviricetes sp.]